MCLSGQNQAVFADKAPDTYSAGQPVIFSFRAGPLPLMPVPVSRDPFESIMYAVALAPNRLVPDFRISVILSSPTMKTAAPSTVSESF